MRHVWLMIVLGTLGLAALLATLGAQGMRASDEEGEADAWRAHTYVVLIDAERFGNAARDMLRGQRGFLLTGSPDYLEPYDAGRAVSREILAKLREETADNAVQQRSLAELETLHGHLEEVLAGSLELARSGRQEEALAVVRGGEGRRTMLLVTEVLARITAEENRLLAIRTAAEAAADARTRRYAVLLTLLGAALLAGSAALGAVAARQSARRGELDRLLGTVLASIEGVAFAKDAEGRYTLMSEVGARLFGRPVAEILGRTDSELLSPLFATQAAFHEARAMEAGGPLGFQESVEVGGRELLLSTTRTPLRDREGRVVGIAGVALDVTERREAEMELARAQAAAAAVFELAAIGIAQADPVTGRLVKVNAKMAEITGHSVEELTGGMTIDDLADPDGEAPEGDGIWRVMADGIPLRAEMLFRRRDGSSVPVLASMTLARAPDGQPLRMMALVEEVAGPSRAGGAA